MDGGSYKAPIEADHYRITVGRLLGIGWFKIEKHMSR